MLSRYQWGKTKQAYTHLEVYKLVSGYALQLSLVKTDGLIQMVTDFKDYVNGRIRTDL